MLFAAVALGLCTSGTRPSVVKQLEACALIAPSSCPFSGLTQGALQAAKVLAQLKQVAPQWSIDGAGQHLDPEARRQVARPRHPLLQQPAEAALAGALHPLCSCLLSNCFMYTDNCAGLHQGW